MLYPIQFETDRAPLLVDIPDGTEPAYCARVALETAIGDKADLTGATLTGADLAWTTLADARLTGANLTRADLAGSTLTGADLTGATLSGARLADAWMAGATLSGARLTGARLTGATLIETDLSWAQLTAANLTKADLTGANLTGADLAWTTLADARLPGATLTGANLTGARLARAIFSPPDHPSWAPIRADLARVLDQAQPEIPALLAALRAGRVDGSAYNRNGCGCLCGTIAIARGVKAQTLPFVDSYSPVERFFYGISLGDTPATNPLARIVQAWILTYQVEHRV
jgi:uncharacterized protein YjbI with pentapeptide repeats